MMWACHGGTFCDHPELASRQTMIRTCLCEIDERKADKAIARSVRALAEEHPYDKWIRVGTLVRIIDRADGQ